MLTQGIEGGEVEVQCLFFVVGTRRLLNCQNRGFRFRLMVFENAIPADDDGRSGLLGYLMGASGRALEGGKGKAQIGVAGLFNGFGIHDSFQSSNTGCAPELSYKAHVSTWGAYKFVKFSIPAAKRRRMTASGMLWPPC